MAVYLHHFGSDWNIWILSEVLRVMDTSSWRVNAMALVITFLFFSATSWTCVLLWDGLQFGIFMSPCSKHLQTSHSHCSLHSLWVANQLLWHIIKWNQDVEHYEVNGLPYTLRRPSAESTTGPKSSVCVWPAVHSHSLFPEVRAGVQAHSDFRARVPVLFLSRHIFQHAVLPYFQRSTKVWRLLCLFSCIRVAHLWVNQLAYLRWQSVCEYFLHC